MLFTLLLFILTPTPRLWIICGAFFFHARFESNLHQTDLLHGSTPPRAVFSSAQLWVMPRQSPLSCTVRRAADNLQRKQKLSCEKWDCGLTEAGPWVTESSNLGQPLVQYCTLTSGVSKRFFKRASDFWKICLKATAFSCTSYKANNEEKTAQRCMTKLLYVGSQGWKSPHSQ